MSLLFLRVVFTAAVDLPSSEPIYGFGFSNIFPAISFDRPVVIATVPGETNRLFVAEKSGRIYAVTNFQQPVVTLFLDLSASTWTSMEGGLLGVAFHPQFRTNGRFFVYRVSEENGFRDVLSEFRVSASNPAIASPAEQVILSQRDLSDTHNAGDLKFGPDGYLYLSLGDEGPVFPDTHNTPQAIDKGFFSGIIRIDVDLRSENLLPNPHAAIEGSYRIPRDNPFIGITEFNGGAVNPEQVRTEFWAVGMRNPWRFDFDPYTGELISGDVGEGTVEEVNVVRRGGNYGWPYMEGGLVRIAEGLPDNLEPPHYFYYHGLGQYEGKAVIGGLVYKGSEYHGLDRQYVFGDYISGNVWALDLHGAGPKAQWLTARSGISTFARHPADGGILVANHLSGRIERLVYQAPERSRVPRTLRQANAFTQLATLQTSSNFFPFEVNAPLWSDGALKRRWVDLAHARDAIEFDESGVWKFPEGMVWIKHFELELTNGSPASRQRVETRFLVKTADDIYGLAYRWEDNQTNAVLVPPEGASASFVIHDSGMVRTQVWNYPSWDQCRVCHNKQAGFLLGFQPRQINRPITNSAGVFEQLEELAKAGVFHGKMNIDAGAYGRLVSLNDAYAPSEYRVRSYLESNCMHCHVPGGRSDAIWDARITTPLKYANIVGQPAIFYPPPAKIIDPGDLTNSHLYFRVSNRLAPYQMPPLATTQTDQQFLNALAGWIQGMPDTNWISGDVGTTLAPGAAEVYRRTYTVASAGRGLAEESFYFSGRAAFGSTEVSARLEELRSASPEAEAGLMIREDLSSKAATAALVRKGSQLLFMVKSTRSERFRTIASIPSFLGDRYKLVASGQTVSAWVSGDATNWRTIAAAELPLKTNYFAGFAAASTAPGVNYASADFSDISVSSVQVENSDGGEYVLPALIPLSARISLFGSTDPKVAFYAGGEFVSIVTNAPWAASWLNPREGFPIISTVLTTSSGSITSPPVQLQLNAPASEVWLKPVDLRTLGNWNSGYGKDAFVIPGVTNAGSQSVIFTVISGADRVTGEATNLSALVVNNTRIKSELSSSNYVEIGLASRDYGTHQGALYFRDWSNAGRTQTVSFFDARSQRLLASTEVIATRGVYLPFVFKESVNVRIKNFAGDSYLTGLFIDPLAEIGVSLSSPQDGETLRQPASVRLRIATDDPGGDLARVEIRDGEATLLTFPGGDHDLVLTNLPWGERSISAVGYSRYGLSSESEPIAVTILPVEARAEFVGVDAVSQGSWIGRYGLQGYWLIGDARSFPASFAASSDGLFSPFAADGSDPLALEQPGTGLHVANCLFGDNFYLDIDARDGQPCTVGLYLLDWKNSQRDMDVLVETASGELLDARRINGFAEGKYYFWLVQGQLRFHFVSRSGNAVFSAVFLDPVLRPYDLWLRQHFQPGELQLDPAALASADSDGDGLNNLLEYFLGSDPKSAVDKLSFGYRFSGDWFQIAFTQRVPPVDLELTFEISADLSHWEKVQPVAIIQEASDGTRLAYSFPAQSGSQFIRCVLRSK